MTKCDKKSKENTTSIFHVKNNSNKSIPQILSNIYKNNFGLKSSEISQDRYTTALNSIKMFFSNLE